jgi:hypothetical protein
MKFEVARTIVIGRANGRCEVCGGPGYEYSHRRTRSVGGLHQHCPCNGVWSCRTCHTKMHAGPEAAREKGLHVSRYVEVPAFVPVRFITGWWMLRCDGTGEFLPDSRVVLQDGQPLDLKIGF